MAQTAELEKVKCYAEKGEGEVKKEYCRCCRQPIMKHKHSFSKSLANILLQACNRFKIGYAFHLQKDLKLTKNQYNNFQKLRYWGFVSKHFENGKRKGGYWFLTCEAVRVIKEGKLFAKKVITFNNEVLETEGLICFKEAIGYYDIPEIWAERAVPVENNQSEFAFESGVHSNVL